jgi:hypothetical protein
MTSHASREQDPSALEEELVAYLDDELDDEARLRLERRLTEEPTVRESLRKLTRVWDALETLPRAEVGEAFATTAVQAVVQREQDSQANTLSNKFRKSRDWWLKATLAMAACALVAFMAARLIWPDPNVQLADDLPILENIEAYRSIESIEFARMLAQENLFPAPLGQPPTEQSTPPESNAVALTRIAASDPGEKAAVARNWQKLEGDYTEAERNRLRGLERALKQDPNEAELRRVMIRYQEWLSGLKEGQRSALRDLTDPAARLKRMREMIMADLPDQDRQEVDDWLHDYARAHEDELVEVAKLFPWIDRFPRIENLDNARRHGLAMAALLQYVMEPNGRENELPFTQFDFAQLERRLSAEPSKRLRELKDLELKKLALAEWVRTMMRENFDRGFKGFDSRPDAAKLYEQLFGDEKAGGIPADLKNEIFMLPPEEAKKALAREWTMRFGGPQFGRPGGFGPQGPPPDDRGGRRGGRNRGDRDDNDRNGDDRDRRGPDEWRKREEESSDRDKSGLNQKKPSEKTTEKNSEKNLEKTPEQQTP